MAGTDAGRVPWRRAHVPSTRTGVPCSEPMSRRTRTGSIPCERGRWDELGEYVDHRRRDARRQLEDIKGSRTERIVHGAEPLAANLAPFRIGPAPPLYVGDCARDEPAPRTQLSVDSPGLLDGGEPARSGARSCCAAAAAPAALDSVPPAASVWVRAACDHVPLGGIPAAGRPGDDRHVAIPDCRSFRWRRSRHPGCRSCCRRSASAASPPLAAPAPSFGCPSYRWRQHRRHPSGCSRCP